MNESARHKMLKARSELVLDHPFFATLALRLDLREDPSCHTAWSDGRVLAYNPLYIEALPLEKIKGLQCHEVLHLACCHHTRRDGRESKTWNMACDYAINPILLEAGLELPSGYLDDPRHHGKNAEAIYTALSSPHDEVKEGKNNSPDLDLQSGKDVDGGGQGTLNMGEDEQTAAAGEKSEEDEVEARGDAPGAEGEDSKAETSNDPGMSGEVRDAPSDSQGQDRALDLKLEEQSWQAALAQAVHKAREYGELPGNLERLAGELLSPGVNWRELLRRFLASTARNDFSWVRPNRRYLHAGLYLPGLETEALTEVAVAVDVSGSISQTELDLFATELSAILEDFDTSLSVFTCDAALTSQERVARCDLPLEFRAKGGGGTDFRPPFELLHENGAAPACLIYFTDLECASYPDEPEYPVLWVTPNPDHTPPPFGEVVTMEQSL